MGKKSPSPPPAPPPPITREDPAIAEAKKKLRQSEANRRGRTASILTSGQGVPDGLGGAGSVTQPAATKPGSAAGATLLGGTS